MSQAASIKFDTCLQGPESVELRQQIDFFHPDAERPEIKKKNFESKKNFLIDLRTFQDSDSLNPFTPRPPPQPTSTQRI